MLRLFLLINVVSCQHIVKDEIKAIFGLKHCIKGSLADIYLADNYFLQVKDAKSQYKELTSNLTTLEIEKSKEKPILSKLNEFSQYNDLDYYFKLEEEEGEAHDKTFTVSLIIGEEKYVAKGKSLKKAQQNAAALLFEKTNYVVPIPSKDSLEKIDDSLTPTVLLNNVCAQLGIRVEYSLSDKEHEILQSNIIISEKSKKSYLQKLNDSLHSNKSIHVKKDLPNSKGPFTIKLYVGENVFYGHAHSIQAAKHDAASKAIDFLLENKDVMDGSCLEEGSEQCKKKKESLKSPISLAHEAAQSRNMNLECDVIKESGPDHRKTFTTQCQVGDIIALGEGRSKKESKKAAAENILGRIDELPPISKEMQLKNLKSDKKSKKKKKKKKNKIIKTKLEEIGLMAQQAIKSTLGFGKNDGREEIAGNDNLKNSKNRKQSTKDKYQNRSFQDEVLKLSSLLNFNIAYSDFSEDDTHYSLLSLHFKPEYLCFGEGLTESEARNTAANGALDLLVKLDFKNHFDKQYFPLESDIKASLQDILRLDIKKESER